MTVHSVLKDFGQCYELLAEEARSWQAAKVQIGRCQLYKWEVMWL